MSDSDRLEVRGLEGALLDSADEFEARDLLRAGCVRLIRRRGCARVLQAVVPVRREDVRMLGRGTALDRTRYSHDHETADNPRGVWTLLHLPDQPQLFMRVLAELLNAA